MFLATKLRKPWMTSKLMRAEHCEEPHSVMLSDLRSGKAHITNETFQEKRPRHFDVGGTWPSQC
ncbi:hypothetical protein HI914_06719 [Erysiphe necator]|nr:hypothetical protein HI914_06719 [Erysiphe necator]